MTRTEQEGTTAMTAQPKTSRAPIGTDAATDYDRLLIEATAIAYRIAEQLANGAWPERLHWGHVGDMAETVKGLRAVSDRIFAEGEYAESSSR